MPGLRGGEEDEWEGLCCEEGGGGEEGLRCEEGGGGEEEAGGSEGEGEVGVCGRVVGWGATVPAGLGEEEEEEEEMLASWKSFCSWLLTTLFMALCISASILTFSSFGIRPKRTAVDRTRNRKRKMRSDRRRSLSRSSQAHISWL